MEILDWLKNGWNIVMVVLGLGLIIFLHELGHFIMAKKNKVRVEIFSLGFGQAIFKFRRGETEYRVAWLPLGGYVKMAGETLTDDRKGDPGELTSKTPWQRFQIFVAGAVMNLIIAFPIAMFAFLLGKYEQSNQVGVPGVAEAMGGLRAGDIVLEVDGRKIDGMDKFRIEMIRHQNGESVPVKVRRRDPAGDWQERHLQVTAMRSDFHQTSSTTTMLDKVVPGSPLALEGVQSRDEIASINDEPVYLGGHADDVLRASRDKEVSLVMRRRDARFTDPTFPAKVKLGSKTWHVIPVDEDFFEAKVGRVDEVRPAGKVLKPGDVILKINGAPIGSWKDLKEIVEGLPDRDLDVVVKREDKEVPLKVRTTYSPNGKGILGVGQTASNVVAKVKEDSFHHKAGFRSGDRVVSIDKYSVKTVPPEDKDIPAILGYRGPEARTIIVKVERAGADKPVEIPLKTMAVEEADLAAAGFQTDPVGRLVSYDSKPYRRRAFGEAVKLGLNEPVDVTVMTFEILRKLVTGGESAKGLSGPVGIIYASYKFVDMSFGNFVWLLCLITVNLGIFNLLPIPILDGGHNVLLLIEVVRKWLGKPPPSERFVATFQYTGLIFILALFVFVTWNDITRFWGPR